MVRDIGALPFPQCLAFLVYPNCATTDLTLTASRIEASHGVQFVHGQELVVSKYRRPQAQAGAGLFNLPSSSELQILLWYGGSNLP